MDENGIAHEIVDAAFKVHTTLGSGLLESVYEQVLTCELQRRGLPVERQVPVPVTYGEVRFEEGFRADLLVEGRVIVELKSVEVVEPVRKKQLMTYLRLADKRLGLLINFGSALIKDGITRMVNRLPELPTNRCNMLIGLLSFAVLGAIASLRETQLLLQSQPEGETS
jgi:GxxExxY protein